MVSELLAADGLGLGLEATEFLDGHFSGSVAILFWKYKHRISNLYN